MNNDYGNYSIEIQWSVPREAYRAIVPELPGCKAYGATYEEAAHNVQEAIKTWIAVYKEAGLPIPEPSYWKYEGKDGFDDEDENDDAEYVEGEYE
ncbi:MAG TPA: type II toxin-antitoxin system HicB family antitoxin [Ktedonobacteraceae bacterium]|nr:type II toxin-antitoxin system HicB family antitoxin [Ktedonobacteraceae bacterium]